MQLEIKGLNKFQTSIGKIATQLPYALQLTINDLAFKIKKEMAQELRAKFGGPLPYAQAFGVDKAKKSNLVAVVEMNDGGKNKNGINYKKKIGHHFTGGKRHHRKSEGAFRYFDYMETGESAMLGEEAPLTKGGYMTGGNYNKILSYLRIAERTAGYTANRSRSKKKKKLKKNNGWFQVTSTSAERYNGNRTKHLRPGIYKRDRADVLPIIIFAKDGKYKKRFSLYKTGTRIVKRDAKDLFYKNMTKALRSAR